MGRLVGPEAPAAAAPAHITGYKLQTVEVRGDLSDIIHLFVRINSTGKALSSAEKRHAKYYNSRFLKIAGQLATKYKDMLLKHKVLSSGQVARMKHVELLCELMLSIHANRVINKKAALDRVMGSDALTDVQIKNARNRTIASIRRVFSMFPRIRMTRFNKLSDFYSLTFLLSQFESERLILNDRRRNRLASDLLVAFSNGVDNVRTKQKRAQGIKPGEELYRDYLVTVLEGTDEISQRQRRADIIRGLLESLFARKDARRQFSSEQRRILWNTTAKRTCRSCRKPLTWEDFTIDHIQPYSKAGRTRLENAAVMCRSCNSAKGNRAGRAFRRAA